MVGNKAKKAIAAALSGAMVLSAAAPAIAGVQLDSGWYRINGDHWESYQLGVALDEDHEDAGTGALSGTKFQEGVDRYDTAFDALNYNAKQKAELRKITFDGDTIDVTAAEPWKLGNVSKIVIASGTSQADSLVASGLAGMLSNDIVDQQIKAHADTITPYSVPVMITNGGTLSIQAERAIKAYFESYRKDKTTNDDDFEVYIVGGNAAVSSAVEDAIKDLNKDDDNKPELKVKRYEGTDRSDTSLKVMKKNVKYLKDDDFKNEIFVANGQAWADALSVSSFAYTEGAPIVLTGADGKLTADQLAYLLDNDSDNITIKVIGGPASPSAQQLYDAGFTRTHIEYVGGKDRYETSAKVIHDHFDDTYPSFTVAVANGSDAHWADALVGGPFVAARGGVLALVNDLDNVVALKEAYKQTEPNAPEEQSFVIGGEASISADFADMLKDEYKV